jgi:hypothetical protein
VADLAHRLVLGRGDELALKIPGRGLIEGAAST